MFILATVLAFATTVSLTSCNEDLCKNVECGAHGTCNAGVCDCEAGYENDTNGRCDVISSTKFVGEFNASEFGQADGKAMQIQDKSGKLVDLKYAPSIKAVSGNIKEVTIINLGDYLCKKNGKDTLVAIPATVKKDTLSFSFTDCNNTFVGKGVMSTDKKTITFTYSNTYPPDVTKPSTLVTDKNKSVWVKK